jgi:hypothetical protein
VEAQGRSAARRPLERLVRAAFLVLASIFEWIAFSATLIGHEDYKFPLPLRNNARA